MVDHLNDTVCTGGYLARLVSFTEIQILQSNGDRELPPAGGSVFIRDYADEGFIEPISVTFE